MKVWFCFLSPSGLGEASCHKQMRERLRVVDLPHV
jgi:hypothetical protein